MATWRSFESGGGSRLFYTPHSGCGSFKKNFKHLRRPDNFLTSVTGQAHLEVECWQSGSRRTAGRQKRDNWLTRGSPRSPKSSDDQLISDGQPHPCPCFANSLIVRNRASARKAVDDDLTSIRRSRPSWVQHINGETALMLHWCSSCDEDSCYNWRGLTLAGILGRQV